MRSMTSNDERQQGQVLRPEYYDHGDKFEAYKVINHWNLNFNLGNALKYIKRAGKKENNSAVDDLLKAKNYIDFELERIQNNENSEE